MSPSARVRFDFLRTHIIRILYIFNLTGDRPGKARVNVEVLRERKERERERAERERAERTGGGGGGDRGGYNGGGRGGYGSVRGGRGRGAKV